MTSLDREIQTYLASLGMDDAKRMRIARYTRYWVRSIKCLCGADTLRADYFLHHINAAYIIKEEKYKKKEFRDQPSLVGILYVDDATVRFELVNRAEAIRCEMMRHEVRLQEVRVLSSKRSMKLRHPFEKYATDHPDHDPIYDHASPEERSFEYRGDAGFEEHQVRQALIVTLGEFAEAFLDHVAGLDLVPCQMAAVSTGRRLPRSYWLNIYTDEVDEVKAIVERFKASMMAHAKELGVNIRDIKVYEAAKAQHR